MQPLGAELEYAPPPVIAAPSPIRPPRTEITRPCPVPAPVKPAPPPHQPPPQRVWTPNPDNLVQLTVFIAMPTPTRPLYTSHPRPQSRGLAASTSSQPPPPSPTYHDHSFPGTRTSPHSHQLCFTGMNIQQELTLGVTTTPFMPDSVLSSPSSAAGA
jgi:hypothetical protein